MAENKHTLSDLYQMQSLSLDSKISMTRRRIQGWVDEFGEDGVYVSFSGGKDSTVLLHLVRQDYPNVKAVFIDTGLEYPEIRQFVRTFSNVDILFPKMNFRQVIEKYGYPFISKEVSETVDYARRYVKALEAWKKENEPQPENKLPYAPQMADLLGIERRSNKENPEYQNLKNGIMPKENVRYQILCGTFKHKEKGETTDEISKMYNKSKYKFFLDAPFEISSMCCKVMKKQPIKEYAKKNNRKPMTAQMACESKLRTQHWIINGCNGFEMKSPISNPMAFWTEQDILQYISTNRELLIDWRIREIEKLYGCLISEIIDTKTGFPAFLVDSLTPIASVYGDIVVDYASCGQIPGQIDFSDMGYLENERLLKTTGCSRTGCMFCGYGCHLEKSPNRFEKMKITHPKQYDYIMRGGHWRKYRIFNFKGEEISLRHCTHEQIEKWAENNRENIRFKIEKEDFYLDGTGLGYKEVIRWINENGGMGILY